MAAEVHERAAAGLLDVPEPVGMRPGVLFTLLYEVDAAERAFVRHLLRLHVFRREEELLGVEKQNTRFRARLDHRVSLFECNTEWLLADDVLSSSRGIDRDLGVQSIRNRDRDHLDRGVGEHLAIVGIESGDFVTAGESFRVPFGRRGDGNYFRLFRHRLHGCRDAIRLKARADDSNLNLRHYDLSTVAARRAEKNTPVWISAAT